MQELKFDWISKYQKAPKGVKGAPTPLGTNLTKYSLHQEGGLTCLTIY